MNIYSNFEKIYLWRWQLNAQYCMAGCFWLCLLILGFWTRWTHLSATWILPRPCSCRSRVSRHWQMSSWAVRTLETRHTTALLRPPSTPWPRLANTPHQTPRRVYQTLFWQVRNRTTHFDRVAIAFCCDFQIFQTRRMTTLTGRSSRLRI